jgi:hypothetical protein
VQWVFSILTIVSFAVHAGLGCCVHHIHADVVNGRSQVVAQLASHDCCRHRGSTPENIGDAENSGESGQPSDSGPCEDVACSFQLEPAFRISEFFPESASLLDSPGLDHASWAQSISTPQMAMAADFRPPWFDPQTMRTSLQCWLL